ncbi:proton-conducting transporter membrane subunit [Pseudonocardia thermophila]|jgi:Formate hydrogenlyase subunit 3/Multisubunit Na+/H+ antiporter, MnhD subunit|uniref:proton-conducting transporter transmembrane domain-containing protein n=1 Tax=Pseudonocardia thermophila TaxID=1848 RepID=UPI00248F0A4C|nr:proton-conducting transporter membrane subunit [Pseudonocardia thermophila]
MNTVEVALGCAAGSALLAVLAALVVRRRARPAVVGTLTAITGAAGVVAGAAALLGERFAVELPWIVPLSGIALTVDGLGAAFLAVSGAVAVAAAIYGIGYSHHGLDSRGVQATFPLFVLSLLLVPAAGSITTFLVCWELMALTSLVLVVSEHRRRAEVASAARWYAVMTHLGFVAVLIGLLILSAPADGDTFAAVRAAAADLSPAVAGTAFVLCLAGFGSKSGIVPLHAWLPRAHPEAPSHVSALMSAAMVNLGVYGIVRVGFDLLAVDAERWWWLLVLVLGAISAGYGILQAVVSTDLKRLLAHSTTENMGLVLVGVGASGLFASIGSPVLAALALTAALMHVVGHAAFKTLLFLAAGSVLHATGTRDLDSLGGLRTGMPLTTAAFGLGALAASALPPGTAFVSEWVLLQSLIHGLPAPDAAPAAAPTVTVVVLPLAVAVVALTAGLAVVTFVKAFGVGFLARPRSDAAAHAIESPATMLAGMGLAAVAATVLAVAPTLVLPTLGRVAAGLVGSPAPIADAVSVELVGVTGLLSPVLVVVALVVAAVLVVAIPRVLAGRRARREARLWDCGGGPLSPRTEYTATSFAEPLQRVFDTVLQPVQDVDVTHHQESRYLIAAVEYRRRVPDRIERHLYEPVLSFVTRWGRAGRALATGSVHRYLGYGLCTLCALMLLLVLA